MDAVASGCEMPMTRISATSSTSIIIPPKWPGTTIAATSSTSDTDEDGSLSDPDELRIWIDKVRKKVNRVRREGQLLVPCTIFRVPEHIRRCDARAYEPLIVPIGPYHHDPSQKSAVRGHKWRCVRYLLSRHGSSERARELLDECLSKLNDSDAEVRSCFSEDFPKLRAYEMAELMLLDGCFIIHLLLKHAMRKREEEEETGEVFVEVKIGEEKTEEEKASGLGSGRVRKARSDGKKKGKEFEQTEWEFEMDEEEEEIEGLFVAGLFTVHLALYDLLKLENQIPFFVIEKLFDILKTADDQNIDLPTTALQLFHHIQPNELESFQITSMGPIHHLLHLFHSSRVPSQQSCHPNKTSEASTLEEAVALEIPSATELVMAGVNFRKKEKACSFLNITFKDGQMEIPQLRLDDHTGPLFRNLIAFEQCYFDTMTSVTVYALFMDCIINEAEDARLLRLKGILVNGMSADEAVAVLFNQLCNQIYYATYRNYLHDLFVEVNKYNDSKLHRWRAGLMRDYFSNPWTVISVIAALLLLLLTIEQAVFSGLSYLHPLNGS